jgi:WD40 repeat protein
MLRPNASVLLLGLMTLPLACIAAAGAPPPLPAASIFAPGEITATVDDGAATFTPDGNTVVFMRGTDSFTLMQSHRENGHWSPPHTASFSGQWRDFDPAMAPDGSYLLFVSNRPTTLGGRPVDAVRNGTTRSGQGMAIWRVDRRGADWGTPVRLPDTVNACSMTFAPSVAADGTVYYMGCSQGGDFKPMRSTPRGGGFAPAQILALGDAQAVIRDPAVAPDQSFVVYSIKHAPKEPYRLALSWRKGDGWTEPCDLGDTVNGGKHSMGAQLGAENRTLFFYSDRKLPPTDAHAGADWDNGDDHIWQVSLAPWLDAPNHACR